MKLHRKIALALAAPIAASGLFIASPAHAAQTQVCAIVGSVHLSNGVDLATNAGSGTYNFRSTVAVCAGTAVTAAGTVGSTGTYAGPNFFGSFGLLGCTGSVSGTRYGLVVVASANLSCPGGSAGGEVVLTFIPLPATMQGTVAYDAAMAGAAAFVAVP